MSKKVIFKKYTEADAIRLAKKRYQNMKGKMPYTIQRLETEPSFEQTFKQMKDKGYPDWAVYMAVLNRVINYRINHSDTRPQSPQEHYKLWKSYFDRVEKENEIVVPIEEFTEEKLEMDVDMFVMSFLKGQGYEFRRATPNVKRLREYAEKRYKMFEYDAPHKKWFSFEKEND